MDFEKIIKFRSEKNAFSRRLNIVLEEVRLGYARVTKTIESGDLNPLGYAHGGIYFTMADNAAGSAMASHGYLAVTMDATYHFFRSASEGDTLTATANEIKAGQTICVYDVRITDQNDVLLGMGTFTFYQLDQPINL